MDERLMFEQFYEKTLGLIRKRNDEHHSNIASIYARFLETFVFMGGQRWDRDQGTSTKPPEPDFSASVSALDSSTSDDQQRQDDYDTLATLLNLYEDILFENIHVRDDDVLFAYIQEPFKMPPVKHQQILAAARKLEAPEGKLVVEVLDAKDQTFNLMYRQ